MDAVPPLQSDRLILREMHPSDWTLAQDIRGPDISDDDVAKRTPEESKGWVEGIIRSRAQSPRRFYRFVIVLRASDRPVGWCDLYVHVARRDVMEIGFRVDARHSSRGYATEAGRLAIDFAFDQLGAQLVWSECEADNGASARVLQKLGLCRAAHAEGLAEIESGLYFELDRATWSARLQDEIP